MQFLPPDEPHQVLGWRVETIQRYRAMLHGNALYVTCEETCFKMTADEWVEVAGLQSTQEEAYTCLLLHALHAARTGSKAVVVTSEDTDVTLLCLVSKRISHVPSIRNVGHRTAHDWSRSANWPGHWETSSVTANWAKCHYRL